VLVNLFVRLPSQMLLFVDNYFQNVEEVCVDKVNKLVSTPAFMYNGQFHQIQDGVSAMIAVMLKTIATS
jgi:enhancing lycopene biosynthesis protein 2